MEPEEKVKELLNGIGAIAEVMKAAYDSFQTVGFNDSQSLYLCGQLLQTIGQIRR